MSADLGGRKNDGEKLRYDLIPPEAMKALATILTHGAAKYDDRNWEKGMEWNRLFGATQRHLWDWEAGENADAESGYNPLWHALCDIAFLVTYQQRGIGLDDRPDILGRST